MDIVLGKGEQEVRITRERSGVRSESWARHTSLEALVGVAIDKEAKKIARVCENVIVIIMVVIVIVIVCAYIGLHFDIIKASIDGGWPRPCLLS